MRLSQVLWLTGIVIAVGVTIPHLPKSPFLLAQTTDSSAAEKESAGVKTEKDATEKSIPSKTDDVEESERPLKMGNQGGMLRSLNLSGEQRRQLKTARQNFQPRIRERRLNMQQVQSELDGMLAGNDSDETLKAKFQQLSQARQEMQQLQFESVLAMRQVLTPSQRQQFSQSMVQRREMQQNRKNPQRKNLKEQE
jgi:periplasmic protein CpxP/Spy